MQVFVLYPYARCLRQARDAPLANLVRGVQRRDVRVLDERLTDDVHRKLLRLLDIVRGVLQAAVGKLRDGYGDERRGLRDLVEQAAVERWRIRSALHYNFARVRRTYAHTAWEQFT